ncbi:MAG: hypothetical protein CVV59_01690 [Tenericutes bacterium HGW-Tenericutes-4]|jgi:hypothetical protein|nr:MAG: hypothetical protein CVV59_01690 [Tenericutes bacterium HGW-Tenericutes-4]
MNLFLFKLANFVTNLSLLGAVDNPATTNYNEATGEFLGSWAFLNPIMAVLNAVLVPLLVLVATAGTIYAVILGINMAKAETADKREEAKKRIINAVLALVITIALILLLNLFKSNLHNWI